MNKTQLLLNEIKNNPNVTLTELEKFATENDIKTYKGLITKAKNQGMIALDNDKHTITDKGIEYLNTDTKKKTGANKAKREIVLKDRQQEMYDLQQELKEITCKEGLFMNTMIKNRITQICNRMIKLQEKAVDHKEDNNNDNN